MTSRPRPTRLSPAKTREILAEGGWCSDPELSALLEMQVHRSQRGEALVMTTPRGGAVLHRDRTALLDRIHGLPREPRHLLEGRWQQGEDFPQRVNSLIDVLAVVLGLDRAQLDGSEESLELIDRAVSRTGHAKCLGPEVFAALVAYVGEVMRRTTSGSWSVKSADSVIEPWIRGQDGAMYPPFALVFKELERGRRGSIRGAVAGGLRAHRLGKSKC